MKRIMVGLLAVSALAGCSGMTTKHENIRTEDGSRAYFLTNRYGGPDTREMASAGMERYAKTLCRSGYTKVKDYEIPAPSTMGWTGLATDIIWEIKCNDPEQPTS